MTLRCGQLNYKYLLIYRDMVHQQGNGNKAGGLNGF
jgi:hypothetical protein